MNITRRTTVTTQQILVDECIDTIQKSIGTLYSIEPSTILDNISVSLTKYIATITKWRDESMLNMLIHELNAAARESENFTFITSSDNGNTTLNFGNKYVFHYTDSKDYAQLANLISLLVGVYPELESVELYKDVTRPVPALAHVVESNIIKEIDEVALQLLTVDHIQATPSEIEDAKKRNVEHMLNVKHEIDKQNSEVRELKFKARALEIMDEYVKPLEDMSVRVMTYVTAWLCDDGNDQTVDLIEFSNMISTNTGSTSDALNRLLIEVASINLSQKLINIARFKKTDAPITIHMDARLKERLLSIAVTKLNMVNKQRHLREFDDSHLIIYIIDCCKKNSSLVILESPAEIAQLAQGVYSILLSKNFDSNFVYAADVNNPYDVLDNHWHKKNVVVAEYFDRIKKLGGGQENLVKDIRGIMLNCDITMTTPRLDTVSLSSLFECMHNLNTIDIGDKTIHYGTDSNTFVIGGLYPTYLENLISYKLVCIVSTNDHVAVFIQPTADSYYQEFYTQNHAIKLINWLEYFLPTPEEMI